MTIKCCWVQFHLKITRQCHVYVQQEFSLVNSSVDYTLSSCEHLNRRRTILVDATLTVIVLLGLRLKAT